MSSAPVILLTARDANADRTHGLDEGADDYIIKSFSPEDLSARIDAVLRRSSGRAKSERVVRVQKEIDLYRRLVKKDGHDVNLTRTEWMLLECLARQPGRAVSHAELLQTVWGPDYRQELQSTYARGSSACVASWRRSRGTRRS